MRLQFPVAAIYMQDGTLKVDAVNITLWNKHYDVVVVYFYDGSTITATGSKPDIAGIDYTMRVDPKLLADNSVEEYKPWPWSKKKKLRSKKGWIEFKERKRITYTSNHYVIVNHFN